MIELAAAFSVGLLGSLHCVGMCGPLVLAYSLHVGGTTRPECASSVVSALAPGLRDHLAFHVGRVLTYGLLGATGASLLHVAELATSFRSLRGSLTIAGGAWMVLLGLMMLGTLPLPVALGRLLTPSSAWSERVGTLLKSPRVGARVLLGAAVGFLPCGLSWAMIAKGSTTGSIPSAFGLMAAFGAGTVPALLLPGFGASFLSVRTRVLGERAAALSLLAMGSILVFKGVRAVG
ncbi:MAG: sulfite exporter TauE/SafE family protein [Deltaproteobacteria bacterium]|nr:sulfite exporter TauE/SafE family protein [Deltaproteobacteria bacterium]